jgi:hypothetical protein
MDELNFPVTQNNFRFEPPNFPVAEWMLIFFRFKEKFSSLGITFSGFGVGGGVLNNLFSNLGAK